MVTGGARGIGFETAKAFAAQGANVVIADLGTALDGDGNDPSAAERAAASIAAEGGACDGVDCDVTVAAATDSLIAHAVERFGSLDVVVHVAGILRRGSILEVTDDAWRATLAVHADGARNLTRSAARHWRDHPGTHRRILNISSDSGLFGDPDYVAYAAAKAAVIGLTLSAAATVADLGATANVFIPQASTRMTDSIPPDELPDADRWAAGEFHPANVTPALLFLAGESSDAVTGQIIGGWGFEVHQYAPATRQRSLHSPGPWDHDALFRAMARSLST